MLHGDDVDPRLDQASSKSMTQVVEAYLGKTCKLHSFFEAFLEVPESFPDLSVATENQARLLFSSKFTQQSVCSRV